jgi:hypothetical protein
MRNAYRALIDRVNELDVLPAADRADATKKIFDDLIDLRGKENSIPGAGAAIEG